MADINITIRSWSGKAVITLDPTVPAADNDMALFAELLHSCLSREQIAAMIRQLLVKEKVSDELATLKIESMPPMEKDPIMEVKDRSNNKVKVALSSIVKALTENHMLETITEVNAEPDTVVSLVGIDGKRFETLLGNILEVLEELGILERAFVDEGDGVLTSRSDDEEEDLDNL